MTHRAEFKICQPFFKRLNCYKFCNNSYTPYPSLEGNTSNFFSRGTRSLAKLDKALPAAGVTNF